MGFVLIGKEGEDEDPVQCVRDGGGDRLVLCGRGGAVFGMRREDPCG